MTRMLRPMYAAGLRWGALAFVVFALVTLVVWRVTVSLADESAQARFRARANEAIESIGHRLQTHELLLKSGAARFASARDVTRAEWRTYVETLDLESRLPGTLGFGFAEYIPAAQKDAHIARVRAEGFPDYRIRPEDDRAGYTSIIYLEPFNVRNQRAFGFDMMTEPVRRAAMVRARDTGLAALSGTVKLVQEDDVAVQRGFLIYLAIYRKGAATDTPEARRAALLGYVYSPFRVNDFMEGVFASRGRDVHLDIFDGVAPAEDNALFRDSFVEQDRSSPLALVETRTILGHPWTFRVTPGRDVSALLPFQRPSAVLVSGLLVSLLAAVTTAVMAASRAQAAVMNRQLQADLAQRKRLEEQLRDSREKFRVLFDRNPQPIWAFDCDTLEFLAVNDMAIAKYGYSREEFLRMRITDIRPQEEVPALLENLKHLHHDPVAGVWHHRLRDGTIIDVRVCSSELKLGGRRARLVVPEDVTERLRVENELMVNQRRLQAIVNNAPLMITLKDRDGRYILANCKFRETFGNGAEVLGRTSAEVLPAECAEKQMERDAEARRQRAPVQMEDTEEDENGRRTFLSIHFPIRSAGGELDSVGVVMADITEFKTVESQLHHLQKLESVGQLTGGIAHDFNNLLTVISSNVEDLIGDLADDPPLRRQLELIRQAASRGADLVRRMMAFARKQRLEPQVFDVNAMLDSFIALVRRAIEANVELRLCKTPHPCVVNADPALLETALLNLCVNARDAMPSGGRLAIEVEAVTLGRDVLKGVDDAAPGDFVMISVSDTGIGMTKDIAARVFEPFFTTKETGKGTGLGLSMVYGFIKQSGGHAEIESEPGKGTKIKLYLPACVRIADSDAHAREKSAAWAGSGDILVVEDDELVRESVRTRLARAGYKVALATTGAEALSMLDAGLACDLVFTDVVMPGSMTGIDLAWKISERWPKTRVLATSGHAPTLILKGSARLPPNAGFLPKPYSNAQLSAAVTATLTR